MKSTLFALLLAATATVTAYAGPRVVIGIGIGGPAYYGGYYAPPPPVVAYMPPSPGPGYFWTDGYWGYNGPRRYWAPGYWAPPVVRGGYYRGGYVQAPRYFGRPAYHGFRR